MKKKVFVLVAAAFLLSACGGSSNMENSYITASEMPMNSDTAYHSAMQGVTMEESYEDGWSEGTESYAQENGGNSSTQTNTLPDSNRKLIKTVNLSVETKEFDNLLQIVENKTAECGGYIEQLYTYNGSIYNSYKSDKNARLTLRIPQNKLGDFLSEVGKVSNITSRNESIEDVTLTYVDMESRKKVLRAEEERLLSFLEKAQTIEEIITIESRLSDVRYQIESMESQLRTFDNRIDYSTVYMDINEVAVLTPPVVEEKTVGQRISNGFMNSVDSILNGLKEGFICLIVVLPYILFGLFVVLIIVGIVLGSVKLATRKKKKKQ